MDVSKLLDQADASGGSLCKALGIMRFLLMFVRDSASSSSPYWWYYLLGGWVVMDQDNSIKHVYLGTQKRFFVIGLKIPTSAHVY